jgi:hypothetical protein
MATGLAQVKGTAFGLLVIGLSLQHLWWLGDDGDDEVVLHSRDITPAYRCGSCGTMVLPG